METPLEEPFSVFKKFGTGRKQGPPGVVLKPVKCWFCRDVTTKFFFSFQNQLTCGQYAKQEQYKWRF